MKDRQPTRPGRVAITDEITNETRYATIEMADEPTEEGTIFNKVLMDHLVAAYGTTTGTASALLLDGDGGFTLTDGATIRFKLHVENSTNATINVNGKGGKALMQTPTKPLIQKYPAGTWLVATYCADQDFFLLRGSSSGAMQKYGNGPRKISTFELFMHGFNPYYTKGGY